MSNARRNHPGSWQPSADMIRVRKVCAEVFGVPEAAMLGRSRVLRNVLARQTACYVLRAVWPGLSYPCIAVTAGLNDHSTAIHSVRKMGERMAADPALAAKVAEIIAIMTTRADRRDHNAHVLAWQERAMARIVEEAAERRRERDHAREAVALASRVARSDHVFMEVVARGVEVVNAARKVKPANTLVDDDSDALRRKNASDGLSQAIAAAGGWR